MTGCVMAVPGPAQVKGHAVGATVQSLNVDLTHEEIIADRKVFDKALKQLHKLLGTPLRAPIVAGKDVDLHLLYKEVTAEGGLAHVVQHKKWPEVSAPFGFPPSFTSRSFTLKQNYTKLLYDFEQVYFHQYKGPLPAPPMDVKPEEITKGAHKRKRREGSADLPSAGTDVTRPEECIKGAHKEEKKETKKRGRSADPPNTVHVSREGAPPADHFSMPPEPPALTGFHHGHAIRNEDSLVGSLVTGRVDSRIDCGYFVSLNINGYTFQGVLYLPPKPARLGGRSSLSNLVPTPEDIPPQTLRPSSSPDDSMSEPDQDDQAYVSDMTATECVQAFPMDSTMPAFEEGIAQPDATNSFEQAEPLPVDPHAILTSPLQQAGTGDMREDWSRVGTPLYPKPSCTALPAPDWFADLVPGAQECRAGKTGEHYGQSDIHKGCDTVFEPACLHDPNTATCPASQHPAGSLHDPHIIGNITDTVSGADCLNSSHRPPKTANAAQMANWQHTQLHVPSHTPSLEIHSVSPADYEAAKSGHFSREGSSESQQLGLSQAPISSPSGHVMAGRSWPAPSSPQSAALYMLLAQHQQQPVSQQQPYSPTQQQPVSPTQQQPVSQQQPYSPQLISPSLNLSSLVAASSQQPYISSPYAFHRH